MLAMLAGASGWAHGAEIRWSGDGSTEKFTEAGNWVGDTAPVAGDTVIVDAGEPTVLIEAGDVIEFGELRFGAGGIEMTGGTITTTGRQYVGYGDAAVDLTMSGGTWTTSERFILGYQSDNFTATISGGTSTSDRTTIGSTGGYLIVGNGVATANVTLNDYAQLYGNTTTKVIIADGSGNSGTVTMNDHSNLYSKTELNIGWSGGTGKLEMMEDSTVVSDGSVKIGIGSGSVGVVTMAGNASLTSTGEIVIGNSGGTGSLIMSESSSFTGVNVDVGRDGSGSGSISLSDYAEMNLSGDLVIARYTSSTTEQLVTLSGQSSLTAANVYVGFWAQSENSSMKGKLVLKDSATIETGKLVLGDKSSGSSGAFGTATLLMSGNSTVTMTESSSTVKWGFGEGTVLVTLSDDSEISAANTTLMLGDSGSSSREVTGTITLEDSSTMAVKSLIVGHFGGSSETGWTVNVGSTTGTGSATLTVSEGITLGRSDQSGGGNFSVALNIYNGVVETAFIQNGGGADTTKHTVLIDGGTIRSLADSSEFFTQLSGVGNQVLVTIAAGGATFDTNGYDVATTLAFSGTGGLTKEGAGTLTLSGTNTYTGTTVVAEGTFVVSGTLASTLVQVADGAVFTLESLALLSASTIELASGAELQLDFSGDLTVSALIVNGTAVDAGTYSVDDLDALGLTATFAGDNAATLTVIPEPSTYALSVGALALGLVALRRRNRRRAARV